MAKPLTLLISSAGRRVELIRLFRDSARQLGVPLRLLAADMQPTWSPACAVADEAFTVPSCGEVSFIPHMQSLCKKNNVDLLIPTIDTDLLAYAEHRHIFHAVNTRVHVASAATVRILRDKQQTAEQLRRLDVPTPQTWTRSELVNAARNYPLFCKPRHGSRSVGVRCLHGDADFATVTDNDIVQEFVHGDEYTVNTFVSQQGEFVCAVPHHRRSIRDGEVCFAQTAHIPALETAARRLCKGFSDLRGVFCFQAIVRAPHDFRVIEVNPRFGGGYPIAHHAGATMTTWLLAELLGEPIPPAPRWRSGVKMLRYDAAIFVEPE